MSLQITATFVAVFALIQIVLTGLVGAGRVRAGVAFLDGGDEDLLRRIRGHGNFTETVPITLLAMAGAELSGVPPVWIWVGGVMLLTGRLVHYAAMRKFGLMHPTRAIGMVLTSLPMLGFSIGILLATTGQPG